MTLKETYNRIAELWSKDHETDTWWVEGTDKFLSFLTAGANIWDAGCGSGVKSDYLLKRGFRVTGTDFSEKMVELARVRNPQGDYFVHDLLEPLVPPRSFDGVFVQAVLLHIPKSRIKDVMRNLVSNLKPGGYFYAAVKEPNPGQKEEDVIKEDDYGFEYERFFSFYTLAEMEEIFRQAGLEVVYAEVFPSNKTRWAQVIGRSSRL